MTKKTPENANGKLCSCFEGKRPQIYLEEPHRLTVPIVISNYKYKTPVTVNRATESNKAFRNKDKYEKHSKGTLYNRYKQRKALKRQQTEHEKELKRIEEDTISKANRVREEEFLQRLLKQQQHQQDFKRKHQHKVVTQTFEPNKKVKKIRQGKAIIAKPKAQSKYVTVKKL
ncbi:unnamed protein product [Diatraea saccharalis]|uniref:Uncharacterized protein n=1 Tax=Diatraea saccharalis TaxID=40085 RepID=A0A9N9WCQ0_9NEOP|nr:unnamed protein product [Diatraea saccharalis]